MIPLPQAPDALARAAVSSLVLTVDPEARDAAPDYWEWSADAHRAVADALRGTADPAIADLVTRITKDPADGIACHRLAETLRPALGPTEAPSLLLRLVQDVECSSRLLFQPGEPGGRRGDRSERMPSSARIDSAGRVDPLVAELVAVAARSAHHGDHRVDAAVVIPFRAKPAEHARVRNLAAVLTALADQSHPRHRYRVVVVEADSRPVWRDLFSEACDSYLFGYCPGRFNKSWAVNVGVVHGARPADLVCVLDGDILVGSDFIERAVTRLSEPGTQAHWPFQDLLFLDETGSAQAVRRRCQDGVADVDHTALRGVWLRRPPGGCVWLRESLFTRIGGMDERFSGWGGEDQDFVWRMERYGPLDRHADPLVHLYHQRAPHRGDDGVPFYQDVEQIGFCSWPCDSVIGLLDRHRSATTRR